MSIGKILLSHFNVGIRVPSLESVVTIQGAEKPEDGEHTTLHCGPSPDSTGFWVVRQPVSAVRQAFAAAEAAGKALYARPENVAFPEVGSRYVLVLGPQVDCPS